ncbi:hypothetical protein NQ318_013485 [Aromia moschata]|uniref:Transposase Tc1-like domain-containing protein n=1 Tax=Aromia moschata TaxID=1265417 RepID=A0AAV8YDL0_9CUCU|nr:hypothetical protein NQ318_013485 [Aromia moschata]
MKENPQSTSTLVASENEVSQTTVLRILRKGNYHRYKSQLVQELNEDDPDRRLQFCETMMNLCQTNPNLYQQILFSDEAPFCLNGTVNRQNCRYWSWTNPHWIIEAHTQHPQKLNVWAGIVANRIIVPFFFEETLTGERYLEFLQNDLSLPTGLLPQGAALYGNERLKPGTYNKCIHVALTTALDVSAVRAHLARPSSTYLLHRSLACQLRAVGGIAPGTIKRAYSAPVVICA